jgi:hypothetical protein
MVEESVKKGEEELEQRPLVALDHVLSAFKDNTKKKSVING